MSKHTPGPWAVHGDIGTLIGSDDRKMMLAEVLYKHVVTEWGRPLDEAQANARLIAAAPDLLAVVESAANWFGELGNDDGAQGLLDDLRAAIAKATK